MKKLLFLLLASGLFGQPLQAQTCNTPFSNFQFDNNTNDTGTFGQNGTIGGTGWSFGTDRNGNANSAFDFGPGNAYVQLVGDYDFPNRTWQFWFLARTVGNTPRVLFDSDNNGIQYGQTQANVLLDNGNPVIGLTISEENIRIPIVTNQWYFVTMVRDGNQARFYLDCNLAYTGTINSNLHSVNGSSNVRLGTNRRATGNQFDGLIDDLRIYDCALTDQQITSMAECPPQASVPTLSQWGLISLSLLVLCIGAVAIFRKNNAHKTSQGIHTT